MGRTAVPKKGGAFTRQRIFVIAAACTVAVAAIGLYLHSSKGVRARFPQEVLRYSDATDEKSPDRSKLRQRKWSGQINTLYDAGENAPEVFFIGDSFLESVMHVISQKSKAQVVTCRGITTHGGMHLDKNNRVDAERKVEVVKQSAHWVVDHDIQHVVMFYSWGAVNETREVELVQWFLSRMKDNGVQVYVMLGIPSHNRDIPRELAKSAILNVESPSDFRKSKREMMAKYKLLLECLELPENTHVRVVNMMGHFLDQDDYTIVESEGRSLYYDAGHLTEFGAWRIEPSVDEVFCEVSRVLEQ
jgi:hypothetical protein